MWNYVQSGYVNFSAYFNTYYNAETAFSKGLMDLKSSMKEYEIDKISGGSQRPYQISPTARQNFDVAIAKASKVLQLYPKSEFTEDCLFMIGISYYYEGDNLRGQRKFVEAESTFPHSKRLAEAEMYYGAMLIRDLNYEQGYTRVRDAMAMARGEKDFPIVAKCSDILSDYFLGRGDTVRAAAYLDSAAAVTNGDDASIYACRSGNLLMDKEDFAAAQREYDIAWNDAHDIRLKFYSKYYLARAERLKHDYDAALADISKLRDDDKYFQFFPLLEYQRAVVLYDSGEVSTAVATFQRIDTAYARDEASTRSAFRLGRIYLHQVGDYQTALKYFQNCSAHPSVPGISDESRQMATALQDYFIRGYRVILSDSLYDAAVEAQKKNDTLATRSRAQLDTLYERAAEARRELAGYYMFKLKVPDSAIVSYKIIVNKFPQSREYPSALYTLGEYYYSAGDTADGRRYLQDLVRNHPESEFAASASQLLGLPPPPVKVDSSQAEYDAAIALVERNRPDSALFALRRLGMNRTKSVAPQALYALGWIYEHRLDEPDSAAAYYKKLKTEFPTSSFAARVTPALTGYEQAERDSAQARERRKMVAKQDSLAKAAAEHSKTAKPALSQPGDQGERADSVQHLRADSVSTRPEIRIMQGKDSTKAAPDVREETPVQNLKGLPTDSTQTKDSIQITPERRIMPKNDSTKAAANVPRVTPVQNLKGLPTDSTRMKDSIQKDSTGH